MGLFLSPGERGRSPETSGNSNNSDSKGETFLIHEPGNYYPVHYRQSWRLKILDGLLASNRESAYGTNEITFSFIPSSLPFLLPPFFFFPLMPCASPIMCCSLRPKILTALGSFFLFYWDWFTIIIFYFGEGGGKAMILVGHWHSGWSLATSFENPFPKFS